MGSILYEIMEKDRTILKIVELIQLVPELKSIEPVDYWDGDLCAIGFRSGNKLIYICTFGCEADEYDLDLEIEGINHPEDNIIVKTARSVSEEELLKFIKGFVSKVE